MKARTNYCIEQPWTTNKWATFIGGRCMICKQIYTSKLLYEDRQWFRVSFNNIHMLICHGSQWADVDIHLALPHVSIFQLTKHSPIHGWFTHTHIPSLFYTYLPAIRQLASVHDKTDDLWLHDIGKPSLRLSRWAWWPTKYLTLPWWNI